MQTQRSARQVVALVIVLLALLAMQTFRLHLTQKRVSQQEVAIERYARISTNLFHVPTEVPPSRRWFEKPTPSASEDKIELVATFAIFSKYDMTRGVKNEPNFDYIERWYDSMVWQQLNGVIFHDGFSRSFVSEYETERIRFVDVRARGWQHLLDARRSINDVRYLIFNEFLKEEGDSIECVFVTDAWDVTVQHNPCQVVRQYPRAKVFVGNDNTPAINYNFLQVGWQRCYPEIPFPLTFHGGWALNPGVLGGRTENLRHFLDLLEEEFVISDANKNCNLISVNRLIYTRYRLNEVFTGFPLHSIFKGYETTSRAAVVHK